MNLDTQGHRGGATPTIRRGRSASKKSCDGEEGQDSPAPEETDLMAAIAAAKDKDEVTATPPTPKAARGDYATPERRSAPARPPARAEVRPGLPARR